MSTLVIRDLDDSKNLDRAAMAGVYGGFFGGEFPSIPLLSSANYVADVDNAQAFGITTAATNNSAIEGLQLSDNKNGWLTANQDIHSTQDSTAETYDIGNIDVSVGR